MCTAKMNSNNSDETTTAMAKKKKAAPKKLAAKFKKAPGAPRRFKSAFIFFSTEKHKEIRSDMGDKGNKEKTTNVAKMVSEAWKNLSPEERDVWDEKARLDKERYDLEKSLYDGPWKVPAIKSSKDPNAPKRPMSAFLAYSNSKRSAVKRENPGLTNAEVSRVLASLWRNADEQEKKRFIDEEFALRQKYKSSIADWRATEEKEKDIQRRTREELTLRTMEAHKRHLEDDNRGEAMYRQFDNSQSTLPLLQMAPHHFASLNDGRDRGDFGRASFPEHYRDDGIENSLSMDHHHSQQLQQPMPPMHQPMHQMMGSSYGAYGNDHSMSARVDTSAFNSAQSLYDHQQALMSNLQHQPQWGQSGALNSRNAALLNALAAQNLGGGQRFAQGRFSEEYQQQQGQHGDGDFNNLFDPPGGY
ncbi:high mobility group [Fragilaria crotonensis]|nr:high mobility group [Fragilaria crotonensis]